MTDWRGAQIAELERQPAERDARIAELEHRLAHFEEVLRRSSKPPSSDGPKKTKRPHLPTGKKPGGQPGHHKHERPFAPPDKVTERVLIKQPSCERCARILSGFDAEPRLHHVWELPPIEPNVTEDRLHALGCRGCGHVTRAALPEVSVHGIAA
jgi:transposase